MRILAAFAALALAACTPALPPVAAGLPANPAALADRTVADERLASGLELGYQAWAYAIELGVDNGVFKGARAAQLAHIDREVYAAVLLAREAYKTANAADYLTAYTSAKATLARAIVAAKGLK